ALAGDRRRAVRGAATARGRASSYIERGVPSCRTGRSGGSGRAFARVSRRARARPSLSSRAAGAGHGLAPPAGLGRRAAGPAALVGGSPGGRRPRPRDTLLSNGVVARREPVRAARGRARGALDTDSPRPSQITALRLY